VLIWIILTSGCCLSHFSQYGVSVGEDVDLTHMQGEKYAELP